MKRQQIIGGRQIVILCEGDTEELAVKHFIRRQWDADGLKAIGLRPIILNGKLEDVFDYVPRYKRDPKIIAVFTLIDLYGMNRVVHGNNDELPHKVARVKKWLRDGFEAEFNGFFFPHVSVHEVEAWILAEGVCLAHRLNDLALRPDPYAEGKNFTQYPSRIIDNLFKNHRGYGYNKITDSTALFKCLQFQPVYNTCRHFQEFYDELKLLGQTA